MKLSNRTYDMLNDIVKIGIPAIAAFYAACAMIMDLEYSDAVVGIAAALTTLLGIWLKILQTYYVPPVDGAIDIDASNEEMAKVELQLDNSDVFEHQDGDVINLKINSNVEEYKDRIADNF